MVNIKLISLFNKELIGVYLYIDVGCNRASYRVGRLLKGLYMYFCIVCVRVGLGCGSVLTDSWETCEGSGFLYCVYVFGGRGGVFLQRARRLVKGLYLCTDVPVL